MSIAKKTAGPPDVHRLTGSMRDIHREYGLWIIGGATTVSARGGYDICRERYFEFYSFSHLIGGGGVLWLPGKGERKLKIGDAVLITPGAIHRYGGTAEAPYVEDSIRFLGPAADMLRNAGVLHDGVVHLGTVRRLLPIIEQAQDPSRDAQIRANLELQKLLVESYLEHRNSDGGSGPVPELIEMLKSDSERWWTVSEMAELCKLSDDQLRRLFLRHTGMKPKEYIEHLKLRGAAELLTAEPDLPITAVAAHFGYGDPFHFSRRFKQVIGLTPGACRREFE